MAKHERKIWRVAPGKGGKWWDECKENGCIVIGWSKVAREAPNYDFREWRSREGLREEFQKRGVGGWSEVWRFVHEIQPGDIIVAKKEKEKMGQMKFLGLAS
jgi:predicted Mrr-cat superfamily restriction endonuclease